MRLWFSLGNHELLRDFVFPDFDLSTSLSLSALSPTEKQRLYDALDYSESNVETNYPKEV